MHIIHKGLIFKIYKKLQIHRKKTKSLSSQGDTISYPADWQELKSLLNSATNSGDWGPVRILTFNR